MILKENFLTKHLTRNFLVFSCILWYKVFKEEGYHDHIEEKIEGQIFGPAS